MLGILPVLPVPKDVVTGPSPFPPEMMSTLNEMAGKTWVAEFEAGGVSYKVEEKIDWDEHGAFLRSDVRLTDESGALKLHTLGILGYHPIRQRIVLWNFNSRGEFAVGVQAPGQPGKGLSFDVETLEGSTLTWKFASTRVESDPPQIVVEMGPAPGPGINPIMTPITYRPAGTGGEEGPTAKGP